LREGEHGNMDGELSFVADFHVTRNIVFIRLDSLPNLSIILRPRVSGALKTITEILWGSIYFNAKFSCLIPWRFYKDIFLGPVPLASQLV
jgi:hypothetical protein